MTYYIYLLLLLHADLLYLLERARRWTAVLRHGVRASSDDDEPSGQRRGVHAIGESEGMRHYIRRWRAQGYDPAPSHSSDDEHRAQWCAQWRAGLATCALLAWLISRTNKSTNSIFSHVFLAQRTGR
jgi:hypothetical protein